MTVKGGTTPACAACKYQRRKCSPNCPLAPYFPANQPKMFQNVHRLYGVSNVTKILKSLKTDLERDHAMTSIIYESNMREMFPVHGCCYVEQQLQLKLQYAFEELRCVNIKLAHCRAKHALSPSAHLEFGLGSAHQNQLDDSPRNISGGPTQFEYGSSSSSDVPMLANNSNQYLLSENNSGGFGFCSDVMSNSNLTAIQEQMEAFGIEQFPHHQFEEPVMNLRTEERRSHVENKEGAIESRYNKVVD